MPPQAAQTEKTLNTARVQRLSAHFSLVIVVLQTLRRADKVRIAIAHTQRIPRRRLADALGSLSLSAF